MPTKLVNLLCLAGFCGSYATAAVAGVEMVFSQNSNNAAQADRIKHSKTRSFQAVQPATEKYRRVEAYHVRYDEKGNPVSEYVHGELEKGKNNIYTGYLYNRKNEKTFVYGNPRDGILQSDQHGDFMLLPQKPDSSFE